MSDEIKKMDIAEFQEMGLLQEVNRQFFHPLGLALEVVVEPNHGTVCLSGIWDYRDDPEGVLYGELDRAKVISAQAFQSKQHKKRRETVGFVIQTFLNG